MCDGGGTSWYYGEAWDAFGSMEDFRRYSQNPYFNIFMQASVSVVFYGAGIPYILRSILNQGRYLMNSLNFGRKYGNLYKKYDRHWAWWEVVKMMHKLIMNIVALQPLRFMEGMDFQLFFGCFIQIFFLLAQVFAQPMYENHLDMMENLSIFSTWLTMFNMSVREVQITKPSYDLSNRLIPFLDRSTELVLVMTGILIVFFLMADLSLQGVRAYKKSAGGEGKYGKSQLLVLNKLDDETIHLQKLADRYFEGETLSHIIDWIQLANEEERHLFKAALESFNDFILDHPAKYSKLLKSQLGRGIGVGADLSMTVGKVGLKAAQKGLKESAAQSRKAAVATASASKATISVTASAGKQARKAAKDAAGTGIKKVKKGGKTAKVQPEPSDQPDTSDDAQGPSEAP